MANYNVTITDEGAALLATVIATQGTITFTEARLSDTNYDGAAQTLTENTFAGTFLTTTVSASKNSATELKASAIFHSSGVTEPHDMYSLGIIGTDGNTTALVCVLTTTNPDNVEPTDSLSSTYTFNAFIGVSSTDNITVTGTAAGIVYETDVVDNLVSTATNKPLSANQGRVLNEKVESLTNPNLIDNPWFTVNQRGVTSGGFDVSYKMDRWQTSYTANTSGTWLLSSSGLSVDTTNVLSGNNYFAQKYSVPLDTSKLYTASVMLSDGTVLSYVITSFPTSLTAPFGSLYITATDFTITIGAGKTVTFRAVKLELGSVSTLANDVEPNYTSELLKCQRYFYRIKSNAASTWLSQCLGMDSTTARTALFTPVEMNGTPTIVLGGTVALYDTTYHIISSITVKSKAANYISVDCATSGALTAGKLYSLYLANANEYIDLVAN